MPSSGVVAVSGEYSDLYPSSWPWASSLESFSHSPIGEEIPQGCR